MKGVLVGSVLSSLFMVSCGDAPGYSFGVYDERVAELAPIADRYCARAESCEIRPLGEDYDYCRLWLGVNIVDDSQRSEACEFAWRAVVECVETSPCVDFPAFGDSGACADHLDAATGCTR